MWDGLIARHKTLRAVREALGSRYSFATWGQYAAGVRPLNHTMREELRRAFGLPALGLTASEALSRVDPGKCEVWEDGSGGPYVRVLLYATGRQSKAKLAPSSWRPNLPVGLKGRAAASGKTPAELIEFALGVLDGDIYG